MMHEPKWEVVSKKELADLRGFRDVIAKHHGIVDDATLGQLARNCLAVAYVGRYPWWIRLITFCVRRRKKG